MIVIKEIVKFIGRKLIEKLSGGSSASYYHPAPAPVEKTSSPPIEAPVPVTEVTALEESTTPVVEAVRATIPSTAPCRNRKNIQTGQPCENQVPVHNRTWGLCAQCLHKCQGGCNRVIPVFHSVCKQCQTTGKVTRPCKGKCGTELAFTEALYCANCGHQCAGPDCTAVIPNYFEYCMAEPCQDAKWEKDHPVQPRFGTSLGAKLTAAKKAAKSENDRALREKMKGEKRSKPAPGRK